MEPRRTAGKGTGLFEGRLHQDLEALTELLARPGFGRGPHSIGAELELFLVDRHAYPFGENRRVLAATEEPRIQLELGRFNLELNTLPVELAGQPFARLGAEMQDLLAAIGAAALPDGRPAVIGILPTLRWCDLDPEALTDELRYHGLREGLLRSRGRSLRVNIDGDEPLEMHCRDITLEAAATSFHVHLRVDPGDFERVYNAVQLAVIPTLAAAGNSPLLLGHLLWEETRVPMLRQWSSQRRRTAAGWRWIHRVSYGAGWLQGGAPELFRQSVELYPPLLQELSLEEDPLGCVRAGGTPDLDELRLHVGTVWRWNRPVYDPTEGGHLRIEMRALPAGPTVIDMLANTAFLVGLVAELAKKMERWVIGMPFEQVRRSFFRAARYGLGAELCWPGSRGHPEWVPADRLVAELVSLARRGLEATGVESVEAERLLGIFAERAASGQTGARWQRRTLLALEREMSREQALEVLLERYLELAAEGRPVHLWPLPA